MSLQKQLPRRLPEQSPDAPAELDYLGGIGPEDLRPPEYRLVQGQSQAVIDRAASPGQFYSPQTGVAKDQIEGIVLSLQKTRVLWDKEELGAPLCASDDSVTPRPGGTLSYDTCTTCPLRNTDCNQGYTIIALEDGNPDRPFIMRFQSVTAVTPIQNYLTAITVTYHRKPFTAWTVITSVERTNRNGQHYFVPIPRATASSFVGDVDYQKVANEYLGKRETWSQAPTGDDSMGMGPEERATTPTEPAYPRTPPPAPPAAPVEPQEVPPEDRLF